MIGYLIELLGDEVFPPGTLSTTIPALNHRFAGGKTDSPNMSVFFQGHGGKYEVIVDWRLFA